MSKVLFLSPHFDDVAFSCGGTFRALATRGWEATLCTIFTRSVPNPTGFALACQIDKGLAPQVDYLALRRAEDDAAAVALAAANVERLELTEAPHRGYESATALFGPFVAADEVASEIEALLSQRLDRYDLIFGPQALGNHVDHRRVRDALLELTRARALEERIVWYRDAPYAIRDPAALPDDSIVGAFPAAFAFPLDDAALRAKLVACAAYTSQLAFQFGGEASMHEQMRAFALAEGSRFAMNGASEIFRATDSALLR